MEKKRIYPEQTPPQNIPYASSNKKMPFSYIVPKDETVIIEQDANGVLYLSTGISKVATPVLTVDGYTVSAVCATEGAVIYYTTDGSTPSINSSVYSTPVTMQGKEFRFVAVKNGMVNSNEASVTTGINYFRFVAVENNTIIVMNSQLATPPVLEYSTDGGKTFNSLDFSLEKGIFISEEMSLVNAGDVVYMRGKNESFTEGKEDYSHFDINGVARAEGNIMTLLDFEDPERKTLEKEGVFKSLFSGCTGLTAAPELPAETLSDNCYHGMFQGCTGLTAAPELPANTLKNGCYNSMFYGCAGLTAAPELPAETLADGCYSSMFSGCIGLKSVTIHIITWNILYTDNWLYGVTGSGTFTKPAKTNMGTAGPSTVPVGWTVIDI